MAVAGVEHPPAAAVSAGPAEEGPAGGDEAYGTRAVVVDAASEEAHHGWSRVELAEPAEESRTGDEAAPALAGEGGADEARRVVRRDSGEDLLHDLVRQCRRQPRGHDAWPDSKSPAAAGARIWSAAAGAEERGGGEIPASGWVLVRVNQVNGRPG